MKWREGTWAVCPFCNKPRTKGDGPFETVFDMPNYDKKIAKSRRHYYECGTVLDESVKIESGPSIGHISTIKICPAAYVILSRSLSFVANKFDLITLHSFDTCALVAEKAANYTAKAIYMSIRNSYALQDNFRLPPIPCLASHIRDVAKEKLKE